MRHQECFAVKAGRHGLLDVSRKTFLQSVEDIHTVNSLGNIYFKSSCQHGNYPSSIYMVGSRIVFRGTAGTHKGNKDSIPRNIHLHISQIINYTSITLHRCKATLLEDITFR